MTNWFLGDCHLFSWDSATEKAKILNIDDFGTFDEVREMAKPIREAKSRAEAERALESIISGNSTVLKR